MHTDRGNIPILPLQGTQSFIIHYITAYSPWLSTEVLKAMHTEPSWVFLPSFWMLAINIVISAEFLIGGILTPRFSILVNLLGPQTHRLVYRRWLETQMCMLCGLSIFDCRSQIDLHTLCIVVSIADRRLIFVLWSFRATVQRTTCIKKAVPCWG